MLNKIVIEYIIYERIGMVGGTVTEGIRRWTM